MTKIRISREELLAKLNAAKALAVKEDEKNTVKHHADEERALLKFRESLQKAMKWDYKTAKKHHFNVDGREFQPSCPSRHVVHIERAITEMKMDSQSKYALPNNHEWIKAATWLPASQRPKTSVCD